MRVTGLLSVLAIASLVGCGASELPPSSAPQARAPSCAGLSFDTAEGSYCVQPARVSFSDARAACEAQGMHLASIHSVDENAAVQRALGTAILDDPMQPFWIGLFEPEEGRWFWTTEVAPSFGAWAPGEPNDRGGENCVSVIGASGAWNDDTCTEPRAYLCEPAGDDAPMACTGMRVPLDGEDACFYAAKRSWLDAYDACKASGGRLATVDSAAANASLARALAPKVVDPHLWIGATDQGVEAAWVWTDGSAWTFSGFAPGEPNDQNKNEDCSEWDATTGQWNDLPCSEVRGALCEAPASSVLIAR